MTSQSVNNLLSTWFGQLQVDFRISHNTIESLDALKDVELSVNQRS